MAYTPINWQTGDTITAEKLNRCDNGWSVENSTTTYFDGNITTVDEGEGPYTTLTLTEALPTTVGSVATITFNGTAYNCICFDDEGYLTYGGAYQDFSNYPFNLSYWNSEWGIYTEAAGTYSIKIVGASATVETSANFQTAVNSFLVSEIFIAINSQTTWQAIYDAMTANKAVFVKETSTDSVTFYMVTLCRIINGTYEVATLYSDGGYPAARFYNASSANGTIYPT